MDLDLIQDLPILNFPPAIKIRSNTNRDDDGGGGGCTTPTSSDHKIPPCTATTPPPPPQKPRPPTTPSSLGIRSCKRKLMTSLSKYEIIVNKDEIDRFFSSVYNQTMTSSTTTTTTTALTVAKRRRSFRSCSQRYDQ
ncbi:Cyclin-dependent protein kinase inhibitor SIM [Cardamine amara subsp. amara]|uniref:Cyclin-dependent protein kinase inhibitor SIM n=1 Tax=Cardamine amara subsp. amara TaxID=228776 RepID=A0ABD1A3R2_CARAN